MNRFSVSDYTADSAREAISRLREEFEEAREEAKRKEDGDDTGLVEVREDINDLVDDLRDLVKTANHYLDDVRGLEEEAEEAHEAFLETEEAGEAREE